MINPSSNGILVFFCATSQVRALVPGPLDAKNVYMECVKRNSFYSGHDPGVIFMCPRLLTYRWTLRQVLFLAPSPLQTGAGSCNKTTQGSLFGGNKAKLGLYMLGPLDFNFLDTRPWK